MSIGRKRALAGLAGFALIGSASILPAPAHADPSVNDVQKRVDKLFRQAEVASEKYNDSKLQLKKLREELSNLRADQNRQQKSLGGVRGQLRDSMLRDFEGSGTSQVAQVVTAENPKTFLAGLTTASTYQKLQSDLLGDYDTAVTRLDMRRKAVAQRVAAVSKTTAEQKKSKQTVDDKLAKAKDLLGDLKAEQQAATRTAPSTSRSTERSTSAPVPASGRAAAAVNYAMAQVGKAYVYGAAGPSAFDCSGLTMQAWAAAGVSLPHSSSAQYNSGPHIPESELQPGDLVFYYSPISHVGMYIGNGMIVNAENPSVGVKTAPLHMMPYVGAVRPG